MYCVHISIIYGHTKSFERDIEQRIQKVTCVWENQFAFVRKVYYKGYIFIKKRKDIESKETCIWSS